jgi:uncharacterized membrane protein
MKTRILYIWEKLSGSFWFLPLVIILIAMGSAIGLIYIDSKYPLEHSDFFEIMLSGGEESARSVLSTIAGAMLAVAGTVFSITLVVLTLASSQFGARLLRNFMYNRLNQVVLGVYVATFIYCLIVLRAVKSSQDFDYIPNISVLFAMILAVGGILLLIVFIHHISVSIQADHVIVDVDKKLKGSIRKLFPTELGEAKPHKDHEAEIENAMKRLGRETRIKMNQNGYLGAIDNDGLLKLASEYDLLFTLNNRPGEFLVEEVDLVTVNHSSEIDDQLCDRIRNAFIFGKVRTPVQDAEFAIHQMVEIAARALSPGINDPYTAITCIDNLSATLCYLTRAKFPSGCRYDENDRLRVIAKPESFSGMMDAAFNQIRQYGKDSPSVIIRLMEALGTIYQMAQKPEHKDAVKRHSQMVLNTAEKFITENNDLNDLKERYEKINKKKDQ